MDVVRTVRNAVLHSAARTVHRPPPDGAPVRLRSTTSRSPRPSVARQRRHRLLVDLSYSMALRGTWGAAKTTALALHSLVRTKFPQDAIQIIGFTDYARDGANDLRSPSGTACRAPTCSTGSCWRAATSIAPQSTTRSSW